MPERCVDACTPCCTSLLSREQRFSLNPAAVIANAWLLVCLNRIHLQSDPQCGSNGKLPGKLVSFNVTKTSPVPAADASRLQFCQGKRDQALLAGACISAEVRHASQKDTPKWFYRNIPHSFFFFFPFIKIQHTF